MADAAVAATVESLLTSEGVEDPEDRTGWWVGGRRPDAVALPGNDEEVAALLRVAGREGWTVAPAGRGPEVEGPVLRERPLVVLSTSRLQRLVDYEPSNLTIRAGAGSTLGQLGDRLEAEGQRLALDPPGGEARSLGGVLASGAAGPLAAGFGRPRDQVLGLVLVTGDGRVLRLGGDVVKNVAGFDLVRLAVGSRGTLGVITEAALRLHPLPEVDRTWALPLKDMDQAASALTRIRSFPYPLAAAELFVPPPDPSILSPAPPMVLAVRVTGSATAANRTVRELSERVEPAGEGSGVSLDNRESARFFHRAAEREGAVGWRGRAGVLPSRSVEVADGLHSALQEAGPEGGFWIHVSGTTGSVRWGIPGQGSDVREPGEGSPAPPELVPESALRAAGSVRVVGPTGLLPAGSTGRGPSSDAGARGRIVEGLRSAFDPQGVLPDPWP